MITGFFVSTRNQLSDGLFQKAAGFIED